MAFLKFFELPLFCVLASGFCNSRESAEEGKVWERGQSWLPEYCQNACRQSLLIKRNRKLCGSLLPWQSQCVWGRCLVWRVWILCCLWNCSEAGRGLGLLCFHHAGLRSTAWPKLRAWSVSGLPACPGGSEGVWGSVPCGAVSHGGLCPTRGCVPCRALSHPGLSPARGHVPCTP